MSTPESDYDAAVERIAEAEVSAAIESRGRAGFPAWNGLSRESAVLAVRVRIDPACDDASARLIDSQAGIVVRECRRWMTPALDRSAWWMQATEMRAYSWQDLKDSAAIGILQAAAAYDPLRGSFGSTAKVCVRRSIIRYGTNILDRFRLPQLSGAATPSPEVAEALAKARLLEVYSFDVERDAALAVPESRWGLEDGHRRDHASAVLWGAVDSLPARERDAVSLRFGRHAAPITLAEIGLRHGVSRERARQVFEAAMRRLRSQLDESDFG